MIGLCYAENESFLEARECYASTVEVPDTVASADLVTADDDAESRAWRVARTEKPALWIVHVSLSEMSLVVSVLTTGFLGQSVHWIPKRLARTLHGITGVGYTR